MDDTTKRCPRCGEHKAHELFKVRRAAPSGRSSWCKACDAAQGRASYANNPERSRAVWARSLERLYGISASDYERMFDEQGGVCAICSNPPKGERRLAVDHDHDTGAVRSLLCGYCNVLVGIVERPNGLDDFRAYLDRHKDASASIRAGGELISHGLTQP